MPDMNERLKYYNDVRTTEMTKAELAMHVSMFCENGDTPVIDWATRFPNRVYAWTVDFHPAPASCNIPIYRDIGVVLHPEIDHEPFCQYSGFCRQRLNSLFGLGGYMAGFALDPDYIPLINDFHEALKDDPEYNRIDVFMCSHPAANCELFVPFEKPMILFFTTRLEFGRNDQNIPWRAREISKWNSYGELESRTKDFAEMVIKYHNTGRIAVTANSRYDAEYVHYFTGIRPTYIPSWCGDLDNSFGLESEWIGCELNTTAHNPIYNVSLIVPYKQRLWALGGTAIDDSHELYLELEHAKQAFKEKFKREAPVIQHSNSVITNHKPEKYKAYSSLVFIPYQTSVMTFFEMYRQNIPIFAPSKRLLVDWHQRFKILSGRVYGWPERHIDLMEMYNITANMSIPYPNDDMDIASNNYWFEFCDIYQFDHITIFDSWEELLEKLEFTDLKEVRSNMMKHNLYQRDMIASQWDAVFRRLAPHRNRGAYVNAEIQRLRV
jgi:hypothetical protein